jgi:folate-binding protein YgfZ
MELNLHALHKDLGARFTIVSGGEAVADYGDELGEYRALHDTAGFLDLSFRGRICLTGADRVRFLHGQVTNEIKGLESGTGCYAALTNAKGRMQADLNIYNLTNELLLDLEPGLTSLVSGRLEKYIVADDVQIIDVGPLYGLLTVQGPRAGAIMLGVELFRDAGTLYKPFTWLQVADPALGEIYVMNQPRLGTRGFALFVPTAALTAVAEQLQQRVKAVGGRCCGWHAFETVRVEAGIPRFGIDMDETNFPQECGIEARAVSYTKGCYIGQETLNRIHTMGHVNRQLVGLRLNDELVQLPTKGDKLFLTGKEVGHITSAVNSPLLNSKIALGYVRKDANEIGKELILKQAGAETTARVAALPFSKAAQDQQLENNPSSAS